MIFIYSLKPHELFLIIALLLVIAIVCYYFAVKSRKSYTCPECGEKTKVEHMDTARCGMCGSLLDQDEQE